MTTNREELAAALAQLGERCPNWRFGQLVANVAGWADVDPWDIEDEQLLKAARLHLEQAEQAARAVPPLAMSTR